MYSNLMKITFLRDNGIPKTLSYVVSVEEYWDCKWPSKEDNLEMALICSQSYMLSVVVKYVTLIIYAHLSKASW